MTEQAKMRHADPCTCWNDPEYWPIIGADCIRAMYAEALEALNTPKPQPADSVTSATPGSDWREVEEGTEYTAEQAARRFLDSTWEEQVAMADKALDNAGAATACRILNHEGAHIFATRHSCQERYEEGFEAGKQAVVEHMERLADEQFGPKEDINGG